MQHHAVNAVKHHNGIIMNKITKFKSEVEKLKISDTNKNLIYYLADYYLEGRE